MSPSREFSNNEDSLKHLVYNLEKAVACLDAKGITEKFVILVDYKGFSYANIPPLKVALECANIMQNHYPERMKRTYMINPPRIFSILWTMISPFLDPVTKDKIFFIPDKNLDKTFSKFIELDVLESRFGGNDTRPFDSQKYLSSPFDMDYYTFLETMDDENKVDNVSTRKFIESDVSSKGSDAFMRQAVASGSAITGVEYDIVSKMESDVVIASKESDVVDEQTGESDVALRAVESTVESESNLRIGNTASA